MFANVKMKALSVAVLGLAGMAFAGSSFAACNNTDPAQPAGAWSSKVVNGGTAAIVTGGMNSTECALSTSITANLGSASGYVLDNTPNAENRYRAKFYINLDNLTGLNSTQPVRIFAATTATPAQSVPEVVKLSVFGNAAGTNKVLGISTACAASPTNTGTCATTAPLAGTGPHTIQIDWQKGASGSLRVWVDNNTEATPTTTQTVDNSAWGGVDAAVLGLTAASANYRSVQINRTVLFDEFDSRRSTFIN